MFVRKRTRVSAPKWPAISRLSVPEPVLLSFENVARVSYVDVPAFHACTSTDPPTSDIVFTYEKLKVALVAVLRSATRVSATPPGGEVTVSRCPPLMRNDPLVGSASSASSQPPLHAALPSLLAYETAPKLSRTVRLVTVVLAVPPATPLVWSQARN